MSVIPPLHRDIPEGQRDSKKTRCLSLDTLAKLAECSPDAMVVTDRHGKIAWVNAQTEKLFGYSRDDLFGQTVDLLVPDRFREIHPAHRNAYSAEPTIRPMGSGLELYGRRKDGTEFPIDIMLSPIGIEREPAIVLAAIRDVSERKRAEKALHESERRLRAFLDNSPNLIFLKDVEGRYLLVNREFQRVFHISQEQIAGKKDEEVFPAEQAAAFRKNDLLVLQGGVSREFEEVAVHDGEPHTSIVHKFPLRNPDGKAYATGGIVTDITARKRTEEALRQSEERFRLLVDGVQGYAIFMLDHKGRVITWNAGANRVFGYRTEEIMGQHLSHFCEAGDIAQGKPEDELRLAEATGRFEGEGWRLCKDGSRFWASVIIAAIRNREGKILGFSKVIRDLTERKRFEQELERERDRLRLLLDLTNNVVSSLDLRGVFRAVSATLRRFAQSDSAMLLLPDSERNQLRLLALDLPESRGFLREEMLIPVEGSHVGQVFRTGEPRILESGDLATHDLEIQRATTDEGFKSSCAFPLINRNRVIGVLVLNRKEAAPFIRADVDFLLQVAAQVAIAVENALDYHQVIEARERLAEERLYLQDEIRTEYSFEDIVGGSSALKGMLKQIEHVAPTDSTVLILGETGSGKERVARAIHDRSARRDKSFIKVNCAAIPLGLLESELFGHEKGAFTGAIARKVGRFEVAHQGTLFLDEVGDIPLELQPKLLRVLQDQEFERLGSTRTQRVDVRLVAATNCDLARMIADRQFRSDLYYRLNVFPIRVPPLRDRPEDIPPLVRHFAGMYARRMNKRIDSISEEDMAALTRYAWPGNVRELQNVVERAIILSPDRLLRLPLSELTQPVEQPLAQDRTLEEAEREHILQALQRTNGVIGGPKGAAARLGLKRTTLRYKMERLGILGRPR